jgi:hypothetical protein
MSVPPVHLHCTAFADLLTTKETSGEHRVQHTTAICGFEKTSGGNGQLEFAGKFCILLCLYSSTEMGTTVGKNAAKCVDVFQGLFEIQAKSAMA